MSLGQICDLAKEEVKYKEYKPDNTDLPEGMVKI